MTFEGTSSLALVVTPWIRKNAAMIPAMTSGIPTDAAIIMSFFLENLLCKIVATGIEG